MAFFHHISASCAAILSTLATPFAPCLPSHRRRHRQRRPSAHPAGKASPASSSCDSSPCASPEPKPLTAVEAFDSVGSAYEDAFAGLPTQAAALDWLVKTLAATHPRGGARVLDVGCGTGRPTCSVLADAGHDVLGIDISEAMLTAARERVPNARFERTDVRAFLQRENSETNVPASYDAITIFFSLIADVTQADIRAIHAGLARLLKPGGLLVFATVPLPVENEAIKWMGRPIVVSSLSPEDAVASIASAGLDIVYQSVSQYLPKAQEAGICEPDDVWEEPHLFVYATKK